MAGKRQTELPRGIIHFLRDCYEADNRETTLFDLRQEKIQHSHVLNQGGDFLTGTLDLIPVDHGAALEIQKTARLYEAEKTLVFCAFLLVGKLKKALPPMPREIFAPLLFFPARVELGHLDAFLRVEAREQRVNTKVLAALLGEGESATAYLDEILSRIPQVPFAPLQIQDLISAFEEFLPAVDGRELVQFPRLVSNLSLGKSTPLGATIQCLPACAMALVPNSPDTRGVLTDLARIASAQSWSAPLRTLTGVEPVPPTAGRRPVRIQVPASLSSAQEKALHSATTHPLTLIIGPPGTGKSYTLAVLALDHVLRGKSVLIASKTNQALDVLADKIEVLLGYRRFLLRGGRDGYTRQLRQSLNAWLESPGFATHEEPGPAAGVRQLGREMQTQGRRIGRLETELIERAELEIQWGDHTASPQPSGFLARWLRTGRLKVADWQLARQGCYWNLMGEYQRQLRDYHDRVARFLRASILHRIGLALDRQRKEFINLSKALRARTSRRQEEYFAQADLDLLLQTFPIWMTTLADVADLLPLKAELFDLAIVDEATQCDMASCLPVFFRARRAAITGDPHQLRHLSFLSRERQRLLAEKRELGAATVDTCDYRQKSILDWVNEVIPSQDQVAFLDEHFRSRPPIIAFSNREFYQGALKIMTARPDTVASPGVVVRFLKGHRDPAGPNREEAEQLVAEVARWVEEEKDVPAAIAHSLGILSPFRDQVDYLFARLSKRLGLPAIEKHRIRIGTAHSFQGEERDIMFLSFVVDREAHAASWRYLDRADVFNVSVTRARSLQVVFCSVQPGDLPPRSLLRRYLEFIPSPSGTTRAGAPADALLHEVQDALTARGFKTWPCYVVAGLPVDLLAEKDGRSVGIDLVGHPGQFRSAFDLEKYRLYERAGLPLFPLSFSGWRNQREACLEAIDQWIKHAAPQVKHAIDPVYSRRVR